MWICRKNAEKDRKNIGMLVATSRKNKAPLARLRMSYCSMKQQETSRIIDRTHFKYYSITHLTDIYVGVRVAIDDDNYLPEIGLYNGAYGTIIDIVYKNNQTTGPNHKEHDPLPDYVVVDFPHLILPKAVDPCDINNPTVSTNKQTKNEFG